MVASSSEFQTKILRRNTVPDEYKIYRAGLEWDLDDPIVIETRDDFKSEARWRDQLKPYHHQVTNLITFCRRLPVTLLADDVGLGKTISAGLVASELIARARVSKILIVCPKILGPQWKDELETKFSIPAEIVVGSDLIEAEPEDVGAIITTYQSARAHLDKIPEDRFQMLVLDEAHKLRNLYGVDPPPQVAVRFRAALEERRFRYVLMLTATPIHNRLWDLYSLVDLLTVARGHQNPFGNQGLFARKFIADDREKARKLKPEARDEFRSIVYGYMSRVRRVDAKLYFPDREVKLHRVEPTKAELELIEAIAKPIQKLNILAQIGILQALVSSPHALMAQLNNMARRGTVPQELAATVRTIVEPMQTSAKLDGLAQLVSQLREKKPDDWRLVVFTTRRETQTTIQIYLEGQGIPVGIINGDSGQRNQQTISRFWRNPETCRVIVSTEAGSEGVNLQVANVLVNYDLPWNPMIVEQRIGRVQRLASDHAKVSILNIILRGTFEEYIVGRLMEKLQMASHAIGDIESLLEASGISDDEEGGAEDFEKKLLHLVLAALAGKDWKAATEQAAKSIEEAEAELEREKENIDAMLGSMDGAEYVGPRAPKLPQVVRSMEARDFVFSAFGSLGGRLREHSPGIFLSEKDGGREYVRLDGADTASDVKSILYAPGSPAFMRLVDRIVATGVHDIDDLDRDCFGESEAIARKWVSDFGGIFAKVDIEEVRRCFEGLAVVRVRATVAHDSYERLVEVPCSPSVHHVELGRAGSSPLSNVLEDPRHAGINTKYLEDAARGDPAVSEFCRFYMERRAQETVAAQGDERKEKKLEDEFTPRLAMSLVAAEGKIHRQVRVRTSYRLDTGSEYSSNIEVIPVSGALHSVPDLGRCAITGKFVPVDCLGRCDISGTAALTHLLIKSESSGRCALPVHTAVCAMSGKRLLSDEVALSEISGQAVSKAMLKTSVFSGKRAEPHYFAKCQFTQVELLKTELAVSDISGKQYRVDQQKISSVSGRTGHGSEFVLCHQTRQPVLPDETEVCELTGRAVRFGVLEECAVTGKRVLPSELERCAASGRKALSKVMVTSSLSGARIIERIAVRSAAGKFCASAESGFCEWSARRCHPDDLRVCDLIGLPIHFQFGTSGNPIRLKPLSEMLEGLKRPADESTYWSLLEVRTSQLLGGVKCQIEATQLSPDGKYLAVSSEVRSMFGLKIQQVGSVYSIDSDSFVGRIVVGKRTSKGWASTKVYS